MFKDFLGKKRDPCLRISCKKRSIRAAHPRSAKYMSTPPRLCLCNTLNSGIKPNNFALFFFFFLFDSHGVTAYGLLENQYNALYRHGCIFFPKNNNNNKYTHNKATHPPHTYTRKKITDAADRMKSYHEIGTMSKYK